MPEVVQPEIKRHQDVFLAGEVVVDRRLRKAQPLGDLAYGRLVVALGGEQIQGDPEEPRPRAVVPGWSEIRARWCNLRRRLRLRVTGPGVRRGFGHAHRRSEEHTSELQSLRQLVCRLLL